MHPEFWGTVFSTPPSQAFYVGTQVPTLVRQVFYQLSPQPLHESFYGSPHPHHNRGSYRAGLCSAVLLTPPPSLPRYPVTISQKRSPETIDLRFRWWFSQMSHFYSFYRQKYIISSRLSHSPNPYGIVCPAPHIFTNQCN